MRLCLPTVNRYAAALYPHMSYTFAYLFTLMSVIQAVVPGLYRSLATYPSVHFPLSPSRTCYVPKRACLPLSFLHMLFTQAYFFPLILAHAIPFSLSPPLTCKTPKLTCNMFTNGLHLHFTYYVLCVSFTFNDVLFVYSPSTLTFSSPFTHLAPGRAISANTLGFLGGVHLAILLARICQVCIGQNRDSEQWSYTFVRLAVNIVVGIA